MSSFSIVFCTFSSIFSSCTVIIIIRTIYHICRVYHLHLVFFKGITTKSSCKCQTAGLPVVIRVTIICVSGCFRNLLISIENSAYFREDTSPVHGWCCCSAGQNMQALVPGANHPHQSSQSAATGIKFQHNNEYIKTTQKCVIICLTLISHWCGGPCMLSNNKAKPKNLMWTYITNAVKGWC